MCKTADYLYVFWCDMQKEDLNLQNMQINNQRLVAFVCRVILFWTKGLLRYELAIARS